VFSAFFASFRTRHQFLPLLCALAVFVLGFTLMGVTIYPLIVPPYLTLHAAASGPASQMFVLVGFALLMPITFFYNTYVFRVFSGKIRAVGD
jgi:cytochrome d ubiquinol oxidase subunit II